MKFYTILYLFFSFGIFLCAGAINSVKAANNWEIYSPPDVAWLSDIEPISPTEAWVTGSTILKTTDGGVNWTNHVPASHPNGQLG